MLDCIDAKPLNRRWEALPSRAQLPFSWDLFVKQQQAAWQVPNCRRRFKRTPLRSLAILVHQGNLHAAYTRDISREGIGFYAPINLFPREKIWLELPGKRVVQLSVSRCKRMCDGCYSCGATYDTAVTEG